MESTRSVAFGYPARCVLFDSLSGILLILALGSICVGAFGRKHVDSGMFLVRRNGAFQYSYATFLHTGQGVSVSPDDFNIDPFRFLDIVAQTPVGKILVIVGYPYAFRIVQQARQFAHADSDTGMSRYGQKWSASATALVPDSE
ncbi:hypothetical protein [Burkholderia sp. BCC1998]|uniref:hypothetical protein n=1 Tax=Burkholderia sp. BCC1998 TaxID=2817447 RepID=UPI002AB7B104|nr:hypothetical protein [Burkholderia sp. BCC1998]